MKNKLNVIQIKGLKGLFIAGFVVCCLATGFAAFPGWLLMQAWNTLSMYIENLPAIGIFQGILLWAIIVTAYFVFRKEKVVVCMKTPQGLSDEELRAVFADMKRQAKEDPILQAMMKAREAELKYKAQQEFDSESNESSVNTDSSKV